MTRALRTVIATASVVVIGILMFPSLAEAQRRRAVPIIRSRPAVSVGVYYGPRIYRSWYANPYPLYYPPYYYSQGYPPYYYGGLYDVSASARIEVRPRETQVFVDGYYAGVVDDFDGFFQRLHVEPGDHDIELFLPGHRSYQQRVYLQPGRTFNIRHVMEPLAPGDPEAVPPSGRATRGPDPRPGDRPQGPPIRPRDRDTDRDRERERDRIADRDRARGAVSLSEFGALSVRVQPANADIRIDSEQWESTQDAERLTVQLGAGAHVVEIRLGGYRTYITEVTVRPGETISLNVALTPN